MAANNTSVIKFHLGNALERLSTVYPKVIHVIYECVQNALDSRATSIMVDIDNKKRSIRILDNGKGASQEEFDTALKSVCQSRKAEDQTSLGQFGIGLISSIGKCKFYTFTSTPENNPAAYRQWKFVTDDLLKQEEELIIPNTEIKDLIYMGTEKKKTTVVWRTEIMLHEVTKDKTVSKVTYKDLHDGIVLRFGEKMRMLDTKIRIRISSKVKGESVDEEFGAPSFSGQKLDVVKYPIGTETKARFELYIAIKDSKGHRNGRVEIGVKNDPFRQGCEVITGKGYISAEAAELLKSGLFEGTIISTHSRWTKERNSLVEDDALMEFCQYIEKWYREVGKIHQKEIATSQQDEKYHATGIKCLKRIESLLKLDHFSSLMEIVSGFKFGSIGPNHTNYESNKKLEETLSLGTKADIPKSKKMTKINLEDLKNIKSPETPPTTPTSNPSEGTGTQRHKEDLKHHTVTGVNKGSRRKVVKGQSTGLRLEYDEMPGEEALWKFNNQNGFLTFNIRHHLWAAAERHERVLVKFQEDIIIAALTLETQPPNLRGDLREYAERQIGYRLYMNEAEFNYK